MRRAAIWTLSAAIALGAPLYGHAQTTATGNPKAGAADKTIAGSDKRFMTKAAADNKAEVELGKLASERASSDSVKQFGQRMVTDHGKAYDELAQLAQQKGVTLPSDLDAKHKKAMDRLSKLSGADFDRAFMREMERDHDADVKAFQREAKNAHDADLKAWAGKTLSVIQDHQQQAHQLMASLGGESGRRASKRSPASGSASPATSAPSSSSPTPSSGTSK